MYRCWYATVGTAKRRFALMWTVRAVFGSGSPPGWKKKKGLNQLWAVRIRLVLPWSLSSSCNSWKPVFKCTMWWLFWKNSCQGGRWGASSTLSTKLKRRLSSGQDWDTNPPLGFVSEWVILSTAPSSVVEDWVNVFFFERVCFREMLKY